MVFSGAHGGSAPAPIDPRTPDRGYQARHLVTLCARQVHYDSARRDGEAAVELVWGEGPVETVAYDGANGEKGPAPAGMHAKRSAQGVKITPPV